MTDLNYQQVLDNLAQTAEDPAILPYFAAAATGQITVQRAYTAQYQAGWDLITQAGHYLGRYVLDKQTGQVTGAQTDLNGWTPATTLAPDRLMLMSCAYRQVLGIGDPECDQKLKALLGPDYVRQYAVHPGWLFVGCKSDVPKDAKYVGYCGKRAVWVPCDHIAELSSFTCAILDIATLASTDVFLAGRPGANTDPKAALIQKDIDDVNKYAKVLEDAKRILPGGEANKDYITLQQLYKLKVAQLAADATGLTQRGIRISSSIDLSNLRSQHDIQDMGPAVGLWSFGSREVEVKPRPPEVAPAPSVPPLRPRLPLYLPFPLAPSSGP